MSSYSVDGLPTRTDKHSGLSAPVIEVKRGNRFIAFREFSRYYKANVIAIVAVVYLIVVVVVFNHLLFQQKPKQYQQALEITDAGEVKIVRKTMLEETMEKAPQDDVEVLSISNKSNLVGNLSNKELPRDDVENISEVQAESRHLSIKEVKFLYSADPDSFGPPNYCVHIFYYPWYGTPTHDNQYYHWNHQYLPHWHQAVTDRYPKGRHKPPDDIGASFYPQLGCYSSRDYRVVQLHMKMLRQAGIGVLAVSWYPPDKHDGEGKPLDEVLPMILDIANKYALRVVLHLEPYEKRTAISVYNDIKYMHSHYGTHPALYKMPAPSDSSTTLPIVYIYDSYQVPPQDWAQVFTTGGSSSLRNTANDVIAIGLLTSDTSKMDIVKSGFDGFYTYFAIDGFTYGSTTRNWNHLSQFAEQHNLLFIPSVGPGYDDTKVRPWNAQNTKSRNSGEYYREKVATGLAAQTKLLSITSFNEWHEGTQIEPAVPAAVTGITYRDYRPHRPDYYLDETRRLLEKFECSISL